MLDSKKLKTGSLPSLKKNTDSLKVAKKPHDPYKFATIKEEDAFFKKATKAGNLNQSLDNRAKQMKQDSLMAVHLKKTTAETLKKKK